MKNFVKENITSGTAGECGVETYWSSEELNRYFMDYLRNTG